MAADTLCVCPMATWLWVCRSVIIIIIATCILTSGDPPGCGVGFNHKLFIKIYKLLRVGRQDWQEIFYLLCCTWFRVGPGWNLLFLNLPETLNII